MTKKTHPKTFQELREAQNLTERDFVLQVVAPMWDHGNGKSLRQIAKEILTSYENVRQLLLRYDVYD